jgi:RsiW-degrading membrane proteinase PrsW (M82 family)
LRSAEFHRAERLFFFLTGTVIGVPVSAFFESVAHLWFGHLGVATVVAPIVEEFAKASPVLYRYERSPRSLMILGFLSGLGFGVAEFLMYIVMGVPPLIRLPAIGFHAAGTLIIAYGVSRRQTLKYYSLAVALHFLNNFFAALGLLWLIGGLGATVASYIIAYRLFRRPVQPVTE